MKRDGRIMEWVEIGAVTPVDENELEIEWVEFWDDRNGGRLDPKIVKAVRMEEMDEVKKHHVYVKVPIQNCLDKLKDFVQWMMTSDQFLHMNILVLE